VDDTVVLESESSEQGSDPSTLMEPWANIPDISLALAQLRSSIAVGALAPTRLRCTG